MEPAGDPAPAAASAQGGVGLLCRRWCPLTVAWLLLGLAYSEFFHASDWGEDIVGIKAKDTRQSFTDTSVDFWNPQTWWTSGDEAPEELEPETWRPPPEEGSGGAPPATTLRGGGGALAPAPLAVEPPAAPEPPAQQPPAAPKRPAAPEPPSAPVQPAAPAAPSLPGIVDGQPPVWHSYVHADPKDNPSADVASTEGLPADREGQWEQAPWLYNDDKLIVDARPKRGTGSGGILVAFAILLDHKLGAGWGKKGKAHEQMKRPKWLRACLAATRSRVRKFGHAMIIRWRPTLKVPQRVLKECKKKYGDSKDEQKCIKDEERETFNWEKELMILEYLSSPEGFSHILMMDADAALVHLEHDTLRLMVKELKTSSKDLFLSDEDWQANGRGRINGGLLFAASTDWTRQLFQDMLAAHMTGTVSKPKSIGGSALTCNSNEQLCLNGIKNREEFQKHAGVWSGQTWNRGGCVLRHCARGGGAANEEMGRLRMNDPGMEIMHFMGGAKDNAVQAMCLDGVNVTGEPADGYGCS